MDIAGKIRAARKAAKITQAALAAALGVTPAAISLWETGETAPKRDNLVAMARIFGVPVSAFLDDDQDVGSALAAAQGGATHAAAALGATASGATAKVRMIPVDLPAPMEMPANLPVRGTAACSENDGAFQLEDSVVDYIRRPLVLANAPEAYALYLSGDSMEPRWNSGDLIMVHPKRPPKLGDHVILVIQKGPDSPPQAYCKRLIRRHAGKIEVEQYNPRKQLEFPAAQIVSIHKILDISDLFEI